MIKIYALLDPRTTKIRYIGYTTRSLSTRLREHLQESKLKRTHKNNWLCDLIFCGHVPKIILLETTNDVERERFWITYRRALGDMLTNEADGGTLSPACSPIVRAKMCKPRTNTQNMGRYPRTEAHRRDIALRGLGRVDTEATRQKRIMSHKGKPSGMLGKRQSLKQRQAVAESNKRRRKIMGV